jgi:hypothetical protein
MNLFLGLVRKLVTSPWFYLYWAIGAAGTVAAHFNNDFKTASPWLGAASILSTLAGLVIFYLHLKQIRKTEEIPGERGALGLFLAIYFFRIRLLLLFSPVIVLFFTLGSFQNLTQVMLQLTVTPPEAKAGIVLSYLLNAWTWVLAVVAFLALDQAGRSHVVAQGRSTRSVRRCFRVLWRLRLPLAIYLAAEIVLMTADIAWSLSRPGLEAGPWAQTVLRILLTPVQYALSLGMIMYMAMRLWRESLDLLERPKPEAGS